MLWSFARLAWAVSLVLPLSLAHDHQAKRHHVHRQADLAPRDSISCTGARFTYFADGLGACGSVSQPSDFIVAVDATQFTLDLCGQEISITIGGTTQSATIMDRCPGCPPCGLDFSSGLFQAFADLSSGVLNGDWTLGGGGPSPSSSSAAPPPPPSTTSVETPTTSSPPPPTTTSQPPTTTSASSTSSTTAGSSSSTTVPTQTTANSVAVPSGVTTGETGSSTLLDLYSYLVLFAGLIDSCGGPQ